MAMNWKCAVKSPHDAHVGCEKLDGKTEMPKFEVEKNDDLRPTRLLCYIN